MADYLVNRADQLKAEFEAIQQPLIDEELVAKCSTLCSVFSLNPKALAAKWESYIINAKLTNVRPSMKELNKFQNFLQTAQQSTKKAQNKIQANFSKKVSDEVAELVSEFGVDISSAELQKKFAEEKEKEDVEMLDALDNASSFVKSVTTPLLDKELKQLDEGNTSIVYKKSELSGTRVVEHNKEIPLEFEVDDEVELEVELEESTRTKPYRFMHDKLHNRSDALETITESMGQVLTDSLGLELPSDFGTASQDIITALGRITSEVEGTLNEGSIVLEGGENIGKARVRLHVRDLDQYSLFPGQIVVVEGNNPTGKLFVATRIHDGLRNSFYKPTSVAAVKPTPFSIVVAAGPWTTSDNLLFKPLDDLLEVVEQNPPELLIMLGPFLDSSHPTIQSCDLPGDMSFAELFKLRVAKKIKDKISDINTKVVLIPSQNDVFHDFVFPQPAFSATSELGLEKESKILLFPNPSLIKVNGVTIALLSEDIIKHFSSISATKTKSDRVGMFCEHLIKQRSFYPLFPPAESVNLDTSHLPQLQLPYTPDIFILPSTLNAFIKNVGNCLFINPGRIARGPTAGTYSRLSVYPGNDKLVVARTRCDVIRL